MDDTTFWQEVRRRRNRFFLWWVGWLPVGAVFTLLYQSLFNHEPPLLVGFGLLFGWAAIWIMTMRKLTSLACPRCGKPAIAHPLFFMHDAKCRHCGFKNARA
jgi:hypothetical protein